MFLHEGFLAAAKRSPQQVAVEEPGEARIRYGELDALSDRLRDHLVAAGVRPGDRVGFCLHKSIDSIATLLGILKSGAAYVPTDPTAPLSRNAYIFANCRVKFALAEAPMAAQLSPELAALGAAPDLLWLPQVGGGEGLRAALADSRAQPTATQRSDADDLAYLLYTSGSTGKPKGVMLTHRNARRFVDWCVQSFEPRPSDRFSSHAPLHFDLSILDVHVCLSTGATLNLIPEALGKDPAQLAAFIADKRITIWYSTPSILSLLNEFGDLAAHDCSSLRQVHFAGEVFPIGALQSVRAKWPQPRYFNLYGPTETNVCTWYELPPYPDQARTTPYPIGQVCAHYRARIVDTDGVALAAGQEGELLIAGDGVMVGYWELPEQTANCFVELDGERWYRTGDLVVDRDGELIYVGRRDRMVKKRGYRIELGEIESCLYRHANVREAAVVALADPTGGVSIKAHLASRDGKRISIIQLKSFCAANLPTYMVPDGFEFHAELPKTSTDKTDYQRLKSLG